MARAGAEGGDRGQIKIILAYMNRMIFLRKICLRLFSSIYI